MRTLPPFLSVWAGWEKGEKYQEFSRKNQGVKLGLRKIEGVKLTVESGC